MADTTLKLLLLGEDRSASRAVKGVGDETDTAAGKFEHWKAVGVAAAGAVVAALGKFATDSVQAYADAESKQRVLEDAYARFPAVASVSIEALRDQAAALQAVTGADGDAINAAQGLVAQYGLTGEQVQALTPLMVDYAAKTGKDVTAAAEDLGKAMLGQGRSLKEVGIDFQDTGSVAGNFEQIMAGLSSRVGGFAANEGASAEGQLNILKESFGDLQEEVGSRLMPVLSDLTSWALDAVGWMSEHSSILIPLAAGIGVVAAAVLVWTAAQAAWNAVAAANPIGLVIAGVLALAAALVVAYQQSETFRNVVQGALDALYTAWQWLWNNGIAPVIRFILNGFATITEAIANMLAALGNIPGFEWARDAADKMRGAASQARAMADGINDIPDRKTVTVTFDGYLTDRFQSAMVASTGSKFSSRAYATGGLIVGPGTGTSDSIPAMLSNGEYVINAAAVQQYGRGFFDRLNAQRFAAGGYVGGGSAGGAVDLSDSSIDRLAAAILAGASRVAAGAVSDGRRAVALAGRPA